MKVLVSLAAIAGAESIQVTWAPPESRMGGPIPEQRGGSALNGDYYYPYYLTLSNGGTVMVACDDYFDTVNVNESWTADTHRFTDLQGTLFYNSSSYRRKYEQVAWLFDRFSIHPFPDNNRNAAMWDIFDSRAPGFYRRSPRHDPLNFDPYSSAAWIAQAQAADLNNHDFSRFVIYTPTPPGPEPPPALPWLGGLTVPGWVAWKKRRTAEDAAS